MAAVDMSASAVQQRLRLLTFGMKILQGWMVPNEDGKEGIEQNKRGAEASIRYDREQGSDKVDFRHHGEEQHQRERAREGKDQEEGLSKATVVGGAGHGHNQQ